MEKGSLAAALRRSRLEEKGVGVFPKFFSRRPIRPPESDFKVFYKFHIAVNINILHRLQR